MSRLIGIGAYEQAAAGIGAGYGYEQASAGIGAYGYEQATAGLGAWQPATPATPASPSEAAKAAFAAGLAILAKQPGKCITPADHATAVLECSRAGLRGFGVWSTLAGFDPCLVASLKVCQKKKRPPLLKKKKPVTTTSQTYTPQTTVSQTYMPAPKAIVAFACPAGYVKSGGACVAAETIPVPITPPPQIGPSWTPPTPEACPPGFEYAPDGTCAPIEEEDEDGKRTAFVVGGILAALVAAGGGYMLYRRWKKKKAGG